MMKRIIALLLALILTVGLLPTVALAAEGDEPVSPGTDAVSFTKQLVTEDGQDMIKLEAYVNGDVNQSVTVTPCDIVLVLDQSGSMKETMSSVKYTYTASTTTQWSYRSVKDADVYYHCNCGEYHKVYAQRDWSLSGRYYYLTYNCPYTYRTDYLYTGDWRSWSETGTIYSGTLYTRSQNAASTTKKVEALKTAARTFLSVVSESAATNKVDHRVSIVGFGSAQDRNYNNTEILSVAGSNSVYDSTATPQKKIGVEYSTSLSAETYKKSLVAINSDSAINTMLTNAVNAVAADGATAVDLGLDMAQKVFASQYDATKKQYEEGKRAKIVVVVTDGVPTHGSWWDMAVANAAIAKSESLKKNGAKIFTVGIALDSVKNIGEEPANAKRFIGYISSDYPNAASWTNGGTAIAEAPKYAIEVSTDDALKSIFADIAKESTNVSASAELTNNAVMSDTLSGYFNLPANADSSSIEVYTSAASYDSNGTLTWDPEKKYDDAQVTISDDKKIISVTNFDYTANCVTEKAKEGNDFGKKLVIYIPIEKDATKAQFGGYLPTNTDATLGDTKGDTGFTAQSAHKDCTVVAPKLAGKTIEINAGASAVTTELFKEGTEWPNGNNNAGVTMTYTIKDEAGNVIATADVAVGTSNVKWNFVNGKTDSNSYTTPGEYKFTLDCTVSCTNPAEETKHTASSTRATGTVKVNATTANVKITKVFNGIETSQIPDNFSLTLKDSSDSPVRLDKNGYVYSATLSADEYTIEEANYNVTGYTCTSKLNSSDTFTFTVVAGQDQELTLTNTYEKIPYTVTYTDGVNGTAFENQSTPDVAYGAPIPAFNGTPTRAGYNFTGWTSSVTGVTTSSTMPDSNVTFTAGWAPKNKATINYEVVGPANCGSVTPVNEEVFVDAEKASGSTATAEPNYRFVGWYSDSECTEANKVSGEVTFTPPKPDEGGWVTTTYYAKFVPSTVTFDLNTLITKKFEAAADSKPIPDGSYTFKAEIVEADSSFGELVEGAKYEGTVTLNAADTASFDFGDDRYLKLAAGPHYYCVSEIGDTVTGTTGTITYDSRVFCLTIVVNDDGEVGSVNVTPLVVVYSTAEEAVEFEGDNHITFTNTYFEKKDPNSVTVDFSQLVCKKLTVTGSKAFTGATFEAVLDGEWHDLPTALSLEDASAIATYAHATPGAAQLHKTLTVSFDANDDLTQNKAFTGSITFNAEGVYTYTLKEVIPEGATGYDTSEFLIQLWIKANSDAKLEVKSVKIKYNNQWEDLNGIILFENTIDTGRDDYIPIIIPTIINKDTGMLNKTDHFAYVIGYPDGTVHPNGQITRAEVATIFFRLLRDEVRDGAFTTSNSYSDVAYGKWYNNPISTMSALGIITGYPDGTFKPNKPITRAEFAAIAARFDETQSGKSATFSDVIGHWAAKEIGIAYYNDWIKGYPDGTFKPDQNITRAEAMTLINRVLERKPESPADLLTNMNKWTDNMDTSKWYYLDVQEATNSHGYTRKTFNYELWRQMLPDPDWSRYER